MKHRVIAVGALVASIGVFTTLDAHAQQRQNNPGQGQNQQQQQPQQVTLPPALQAAVNSGNADQVSRAIATLSAGNPQQAATLATQVVTVAERMLNSNPQAAIQAATAAVETIRANPVQQAAPQQTETVLVTAARVFISPTAQQVAPVAAANLAMSTVAAASTTNNPTVVASVSVQAITVAERVLSTAPAVAVQLATNAMQNVRADTVTQGAPTQVLQVVTTAARIIVNPDAQRVAPQQVATMATTAAQVVSSPAVYQISPSTAIQVMANSYTAVTSQAVVTAAPEAKQSVTQTLNVASNATSLSQSNPANGVQVNEILGGRVPAQPRLDVAGGPNTPNTPNGPPTTTPNTDRPSQNPAQDRVPDVVTLPDKVFTNASPS